MAVWLVHNQIRALPSCTNVVMHSVQIQPYRGDLTSIGKNKRLRWFSFRICRSISRSYSTNSSPPFRGVRLIYRMRRFSWTISRTNLVPRCSLVPTRGRVRVGTSECLGTRDISRRGHIWSTWNIAAFYCEVSKEP